MKLIPLGDKVIIKQLAAEETTKSGIVLPTQSQEKPQEAEVIAVGPGGNIDGKEVTMMVKEGDRVIYSKFAGTEVKFENEKYIIEGTPLEIKKEILQKEILNKGLISKCRRYNIINEYSKTLDKRQIQIEISNDILHNVENVYFWNNVLKYIKVPLELEYKINDVPNKVKKILDDCGYKKLANKCERLYGVSEEILKYKDYVC